MIYTKQTIKALEICFDAHKDQVDKAGVPYVFHPFHLAEQMKDETSTVVALLHDVVEDTDYTFDDLRSLGFGTDVIEPLELLTHDRSMSYMEYISKIKTHPVARVVKLADLAHNSDATRLMPDKIDEKALLRLEKYEQAIVFLSH